jgi:hypothetical protein
MRPRPGKESARSVAQTTAGQKSKTTAENHNTFVVNIIAFQRTKRWATFATADAALAEIARLRRIGFHAEMVSA